MIALMYLISAVLFILGLKGLCSPKTAIQGNRFSALGMLLAIVITLFHREILGYGWILFGLSLGGIFGALFALKIRMTAMPQFVAVLNGSGGGASALVAVAVLLSTHSLMLESSLAISFSIIIGTLTTSGSLIAFAKLQNLISEKAQKLPAHGTLNTMVTIALIISAILLVTNPSNMLWVSLALLLSFLLGILVTIGIGGADMPIAIALLNSYSGLAASATGFILGNTVLIIAGSLVGASGMILTGIMCRAMNRSLKNVLFGGSAGKPSNNSQKTLENDVYLGKIRETNPEELALLLDSASSVIFVPGYGLAVAQAQHALKELTELLQERKTSVQFAIHPVAGRMPGHMNVLLAEADIPYDLLVEMEKVNTEFPLTDVVVVLGANDVTNPAAREDASSPLYGMPILNVDKARSVVVVKRSLSPGFAGVPNTLFTKENTMMLFEDAKTALQQTTALLREET